MQKGYTIINGRQRLIVMGATVDNDRQRMLRFRDRSNRDSRAYLGDDNARNYFTEKRDSDL